MGFNKRLMMHATTRRLAIIKYTSENTDDINTVKKHKYNEYVIQGKIRHKKTFKSTFTA